MLRWAGGVALCSLLGAIRHAGRNTCVRFLYGRFRWGWWDSVSLMSRGQANILRAFSLWTVFVWVIRFKNVLDHGGVKFIAVHSVLIAISVAFAVASWRVVTQNRGKNAPKMATGADPISKAN
jgi:hypothetical protein